MSNRSKIESFEDLEVWGKSHLFVLEIYKISKEFPNSELFGLTSQLRRSAVSIPNNIAEGSGRSTTKDYLHFLIQSRGSLYESKYLIILAADLGYINFEIKENLLNKIHEIGKMLNALITSLKRKIP